MAGTQETHRKARRDAAGPGEGDVAAGDRPVDGFEPVSGNVSPRIVLAVLWLSHFLLWTFGDMFALLQRISEPVTEPVFLIVAPTTAIVQASMAVVSLVGAFTLVRRANLIVAPLYLLLNAGFLLEASHAWEYYLGAFYVVFSLLIIWFASKRVERV